MINVEYRYVQVQGTNLVTELGGPAAVLPEKSLEEVQEMELLER